MALATAALAGYNWYKGRKASQDANTAAAGLKWAAQRPYEAVQGYLPPSLRSGATGPIIGAGVEGIGNLIRNPGQLESTVGSAAAPGVAMESQDIGQQYRNLATEQAGAAGGANLPSSLKALLQQALGTSQEGAQREARTKGLSATASGKRADLGQTYKLLNTILQFISSGRGQSIPGITQNAQQNFESGQTRSAANMAMLASLLQAQGRRA